MEISKGTFVEVYDSCLQKNVIEPIVRIENSSYGELIYTERKNWLGYDERLIERKDIKCIIEKVKPC